MTREKFFKSLTGKGLSQNDKERQWNSYKGQTPGPTAPEQSPLLAKAFENASKAETPREAKNMFLGILRKEYKAGRLENKQWRQYSEAAYSTYADTPQEYVSSLATELQMSHIPAYASKSTATRTGKEEAQEIADKFKETTDAQKVEAEKNSIKNKIKRVGAKISKRLEKAGFHKDDIKKAGIVFVALQPVPIPGIGTVAGPAYLLGATAARKIRGMWDKFKKRKEGKQGFAVADEYSEFIEFITQPEVKELLKEIDIDKAEFARKPEPGDRFLNRIANKVKKAQPELTARVFKGVKTLKQLQKKINDPEQRDKLLREISDYILGIYAVADVAARKNVNEYVQEVKNKAEFASNPLYAVIEKLPEFNVTSESALEYWNDTGGYDFLVDYYWDKSYVNATSIADNISKTINNYLQKGYPDKEVYAKVEAQHGSYTQTVIRTNLTNAYNKGRMNELQRFPDVFPGYIYRAVGDNRSRPSHMYLDGMVFETGDTMLETLTPANGYN